MRRVTKKIIVGLVGAFIVIWSTVFITDYLRVSSFKESIFVVPGATAEDGGSRIYYGFGYSVHVEKRVDSEHEINLSSVEMCMFGKVIVASIS